MPEPKERYAPADECGRAIAGHKLLRTNWRWSRPSPVGRGSEPTTARVPILDPLRGLAALSVAWFHFTVGNKEFLRPGSALHASGAYGWLGVEIFFVISGFVLPLALERSNYHICDFGRFVWKRIIRLDPPYFGAIALALVLGSVGAHVPGFRGPSFSVSFWQLVSHVGYWTQIAGFEWFVPVFWTLAIEVQFYLLLGLFFPILERSRWAQWAAFALAIVIPAVFHPAVPTSTSATIFQYLPLFAMGYLVYRVWVDRLKIPQAVGLIVVAALADAMLDSLPVALAGLGTALAIVVSTFRLIPNPSTAVGRGAAQLYRTLAWLGTISYSLYLVHLPIGGRIINLATRFTRTDTERLAAALFALALSIACAFIFAHFVEIPARGWSSRVRLRRSVT